MGWMELEWLIELPKINNTLAVAAAAIIPADFFKIDPKLARAEIVLKKSITPATAAQKTEQNKQIKKTKKGNALDSTGADKNENKCSLRPRKKVKYN